MPFEWKKHIEAILIAFSMVTIVLLLFNVEHADKLIVVSLSSLSLYYLLSGALVLFNKNIVHGMRLIYFVGLWSLTVGLIGSIYKLKFWFNSNLLLLFASFLAMAVMSFMLIYYRTASVESREAIKDQLQPIFIRLLIYPLIFFLLSSISHKSLYEIFGPHKDDQVHMELYLDVLNEPQDPEKLDALRKYENKKIESDDNSTSTGGH